MAEEWCFTLDQPISELENFSQIIEPELEKVYNTIYSEEEWSSLVAQYDLNLLFGENASTFETKPDWDVIYNYNERHAEGDSRLDDDFIDNIGVGIPRNDPFGDIRTKIGSADFTTTEQYGESFDYLGRVWSFFDQTGYETMGRSTRTAFPTSAPKFDDLWNYISAEYSDDTIANFNTKISELRIQFEEAFKEDEKNLIDSQSEPEPPPLDLDTPRTSGTSRQEGALTYYPDLTSSGTVNLAKINESIESITQAVAEAANAAASLCTDDLNKLVKEGIIKLFDNALEYEIAELERDIADYEGDFDRGPVTGVGDYLADIAALKKLRALQAALRPTVESFAGDNLAYSEQCLLLTFIKELLEESQKRKSYPYVNRSTNHPIKIGGNPFAFTNSLVTDPSQRELFRLRPELVSQLMPYIRLYKVVRDEKGQDVETAITFDTNIANDLGIASGALQRQRGYGVGLKDFTFSYEGTDPFSAKKAITAKLSMFASTFDDILKERNGFRYADLALKTGPVAKSKLPDLTQIEKENAEKLNFRLKAVVGWNVPRDTFVGLKPGQKKAIYNSYITIYLTPTIHTFDFDETGAVNFDIEYLAYIEDAFAQSQFNIFASLTKEKIVREAIFNFVKKQSCGDKSEELTELLKFDEKFVQKLNLRAYSDLVSELAAKDKIYYLNLSYKDVIKLLNDPTDSSVQFPKPYSNAGLSATQVSEIKKILAQNKEPDGTTAQQLLSAVAVSQDNNSTPYFYIQDIVAVAMELIERELNIATNLKDSEYYKEVVNTGKFTNASNKDFKEFINEAQKSIKNSLQQFQQMRVVLGPAEIYSPARNFSSTFTTLGDIPVSLNYFFEFLSKKVISKEIINYPISKFIKDLCNDLVTNFLNSESCGRVNNAQKLHVNSTSVVAYNRKINKVGEWKPGRAPIDDITYQTKFSKAARKEGEPMLLLSGKRDAPISELSIDRMINYYVFSIGRNSPSDSFVGNVEQDSNAGIFHYILGRDEGIIKNISLEKTSTPGLKEVRFEQEGFDGLTQLREVYNVTVDSFLNVQTFPGTYIYVDPKGFSPNTTEDLTRFGIGGYCMITKTTHKIGPGEASTTLNAAWVASKEGDSTDKSNPTRRKKEGTGGLQKCVARKTINQNARWDI